MYDDSNAPHTKAPPVPATATGPAYPIEIINAAAAKARKALESVERAEALADQQQRRGVFHEMYRHDAEQARSEARRAAALLKAVLDEAEAAEDEAWLEFWAEAGAKKMAQIKSAIYTGRLRVKGFFG